MSADLDARIERMRVELRAGEAYVAESRQTLAALEAEREALAQSYPRAMKTEPDDDGDSVTLERSPHSATASVEVADTLAFVTPADARRMATWLAAFAEEHGA